MKRSSDIPAGTKTVWFKYLWNAANAGPDVCGLYAVRMEANYAAAHGGLDSRMEVTFTWNEVQEDYSTIQRSHTELVERFPSTYEINVARCRSSRDGVSADQSSSERDRRRQDRLQRRQGHPRRPEVPGSLGNLRKEPGRG